VVMRSYQNWMSHVPELAEADHHRLSSHCLGSLTPGGSAGRDYGMNFKAEIFECPWMFWVTVGLMLAVAGVTLVVAKRRRWL